MPSSFSNSTCSTPNNDTIQSILKNDAVRYVRKGYGLFFAILIFLTFFYYGPIILYQIWPYYLSLCEKHPFFERYRVWPEKEWPWKSDNVKWQKCLRKTIKNLFVNQVLVSSIVGYIGVFISQNKSKTSFEEFPDHITIIKHILIMMIMEDFSFYWAHRFLHLPFVYIYIHKQHHEYNNSISLCSEYANPIEFVLSNIFPTCLGYLLLGENVHFATYLLWLGIRIFETIDGHCGYEFSWSPYRLLPLSGSSEFHNFHHSHNIGAFGSFFTYWDTICGTNRDYFAYKARKEGLNQKKLEKKLLELQKKKQ
ncbi:hypothetical protein IMG5_023830 [Ichthyophthirius multifiliis]|uniref:Fatty acid hydroxylase domain-containing protein n=1 Tax=Ichthyophthirius multifiliis TaxID=5932 RepID=G0QL01_ICHMU|nr:hypothetical protein IMG5_023830 [Ichthyophthirius multifiliis]EGR34105.1 hypothetical protein IMG5_023830 [Ichthyophthirius multifiliis]|eukprot:XP_004039409.1 hypothetical protein IMG5_023830 [Ichthyophthirius multifiliis]